MNAARRLSISLLNSRCLEGHPLYQASFQGALATRCAGRSIPSLKLPLPDPSSAPGSGGHFSARHAGSAGRRAQASPGQGQCSATSATSPTVAGEPPCPAHSGLAGHRSAYWAFVDRIPAAEPACERRPCRCGRYSGRRHCRRRCHRIRGACPTHSGFRTCLVGSARLASLLCY